MTVNPKLSSGESSFSMDQTQFSVPKGSPERKAKCTSDKDSFRPGNPDRSLEQDFHDSSAIVVKSASRFASAFCGGLRCRHAARVDAETSRALRDGGFSWSGGGA